MFKNSAITLVLLCIATLNVDASVLKITVQCDEEGPTYSGTLTMISQNQFTCKKTTAYEPYQYVSPLAYEGDLNPGMAGASISVQFNGLSYRLMDEIITFSSQDANSPCDFSKLSEASSITEDQSSLKIDFWLNGSVNSNNQLTFSGKLGRCAFRTL